MSVRGQVICNQCSASHRIRRELNPDVIYRFFCKACGAFVSFDHTQVRWAKPELPLSRTIEERPGQDTEVQNTRQIWEPTALAHTSDDGRATLDGVQGIWRGVRGAREPWPRAVRPTRADRRGEPTVVTPLSPRPTVKTASMRAPLPDQEIEVADTDIVQATEVTDAPVADVTDSVADVDDGKITIMDGRLPLHITPLVRPRLQVEPIETTRVRWLRRLLRRGAA